MLFLNWHNDPEPTEEEISELFQRSLKKKQENDELPEDVILMNTDKKENVPNFGTKENLDLSGTINDCIIRHAASLTEEELNEIMMGLEQGLSEKQVKSYFCLSETKMEQYRRAYLLGNK